MQRTTVALRIVAALGGGYGLASLAVLAAGSVLVRCGVPAAQAVVSAAMLGFVAYLGILLWGFACASVARLCGWMGMAAAGLAAVWWMAR